MISLIGHGIAERARQLATELKQLPDLERIAVINEIKLVLHEVSPLKNEPVDCVLWVPGNSVTANDYNPNRVAPPEMKLLQLSVSNDGITMPLVTSIVDGEREVVDGFHRNLVCKKRDLKKRLFGLVPVSTIRSESTRNERIAATIRHNRARGKHKIDDMSKIVVELARRNWSDQRIGRELGMDPDEVLRLKQISGLAEMFADKEFSEAWEVQY
jgi:ParB-like chromosome segregation protein Spo0J